MDHGRWLGKVYCLWFASRFYRPSVHRPLSKQREYSVEERFALFQTIKAAIDSFGNNADLVIVRGHIQVTLSPFLQRRLESMFRSSYQIWIAFEINPAGQTHAA